MRASFPACDPEVLQAVQGRVRFGVEEFHRRIDIVVALGTLEQHVHLARHRRYGPWILRSRIQPLSERFFVVFGELLPLRPVHGARQLIEPAGAAANGGGDWR